MRARTREYVRALRALWSDAEPSFNGKYVSFGPVKFEPKPVQKPHPPIVFGGESEAALRRAAALGDGWYGVGHTPASARQQVERLRRLLDGSWARRSALRNDRQPGGGELSRDDVARYAEGGVHRVVSLPWRRGREAEEGLKRLAERVL